MNALTRGEHFAPGAGTGAGTGAGAEVLLVPVPVRTSLLQEKARQLTFDL